jgi:hypothetical protein
MLASFGGADLPVLEFPQVPAFRLSYRVRLFSLLQLMVAPPACKPGQDTSATFLPRLHHLAPGQPLLLTARLPEATGLAS